MGLSSRSKSIRTYVGYLRSRDACPHIVIYVTRTRAKCFSSSREIRAAVMWLVSLNFVTFSDSYVCMHRSFRLLCVFMATAVAAVGLVNAHFVLEPVMIFVTDMGSMDANMVDRTFMRKTPSTMMARACRVWLAVDIPRFPVCETLHLYSSNCFNTS